MQNLPELKPGDLFLTTGNTKVSKLINRFQSWWSPDGISRYTHAGIIVDKDGTTFEALFKGITYSNINICLENKQLLLIARHDFMNELTFKRAFERSQYHTGFLNYPFHRLFLHIIPPLARVFSKDRAVCSELVGQLLYHMELMHYWRGISPDDLDDIFRYWKYFDIIFEG